MGDSGTQPRLHVRLSLLGIHRVSPVRSLDESFDVIAGLFVVGDSLLVVAQRTIARSPANRFVTTQHTLDVYHLPSRRKLVEAGELPPNSRVLAGGEHLYVLTSSPPNPWLIARAHYRGAGFRR